MYAPAVTANTLISTVCGMLQGGPFTRAIPGESGLPENLFTVPSVCIMLQITLKTYVGDTITVRESASGERGILKKGQCNVETKRPY